jgi:regulator of protease activity HflC (stomatin/prohibitin superfamily)
MFEQILTLISLLGVALVFATMYAGVKVVPQSKVFVVERFGKYTKTLPAGLNIIVPFLDRVAHKIIILERQLPDFEISVITSDNVEVRLVSTVFYRVQEASKSVYRIDDVDHALHTAATSIVRSAAGRLELDALQSSRDSMNEEIAAKLSEAAVVWGVEVTRTEIIDVVVDEVTKEAQRQQLNAERQKRAAIAKAEGDKKSIELAADARLYEASKEAEAIRVKADAEAYAVKIAAEANAEQTRVVASAISADNGHTALEFEVLKKQIDAVGVLASSDNAKSMIVPTDVVKVLGSLETAITALGVNKSGAQ